MQYFSPFLKSRQNLEHFQKKDDPPSRSRNFGLLRKWLDNCLKSPFSESPSTSDMVNGANHCCNLNNSTFTIFIDHCEGNGVGKNLF